jgi:hypothetical protein
MKIIGDDGRTHREAIAVDLRTILARPVERRWFVIERAAAGGL